jgi:hypothetical protein
MDEFFNDRRPSVNHDDTRELSSDTLREVNAQIRSAAPVYQRDSVDRKIRTTAVARHRGKQFNNVGEYVNFVCGTEDASE